MVKLTLFEIDKIWKKKSFLLAMAFLLLINIFLLWYTNLSHGTTPELYSYKKIERDLSGLSEIEKQSYIKKLYQDIQGISVVNDVLNFRLFSGDMGKLLEEKILDENPGVFQKYYEVFMAGEYLRYTETLEQEVSLITEIYEEAEKVFAYDSYLQEIQEHKDTLLGITVFSSENSNSFSNRNIEKEASDYEGMDSVSITYYPSKGIVSATKTAESDILLMMSIFLFAGGLFYEEKEKKLFLITRATIGGRGKSIVAKLSALAIHCLFATFLIYGSNLLFFAGTIGVGDLFRSIQSVAPFMESNLQISVLLYLFLTVFTKALALFSLGTFIIFTAIYTKQSFMPYLVGLILLTISIIMYLFVPSYSSVNWLKFLNFIGLMKTENLYGSYLNFNLFGYPVSRLLMSLIALGLYALMGIILSFVYFLKCKGLGFSKLYLRFPMRFKPHGNLYRHEGYKILVMNRGIIILSLFTFLLGYQHLSKVYTLTPEENYYQSIMFQLEGRLTPEKEMLIKSENSRYEEAFAQIDRIDELVASDKIDEQTGESMKTPYYSETAFYSYFGRVLEQYEYVQESHGNFVYDTGYTLMFGLTNNKNLLDWILLSACMIFSFSNVFSMEYERNSWNLLRATRLGKQKILRCKIFICIASTFAVGAITWICRLVQISRSYPMHQLWASTLSIFAYREIGLNIPIFFWITIIFISQLLALFTITMIILIISDKIENYLQTLFACTLLLLIPSVLSAMGLRIAGWCSLFPFYNLASGILAEHGGMIVIGYLISTISILVVIFYVFSRAKGNEISKRSNKVQNSLQVK